MQSDQGSSDSSSDLYSLLKSSDEYLLTTCESSAEVDKESSSHPPRPLLQDPFWLQNVEVTQELLYNYQLKTRDMVEVLKDDMKRLERLVKCTNLPLVTHETMYVKCEEYQPQVVERQLEELYEELDERGEVSQDYLNYTLSQEY